MNLHELDHLWQLVEAARAGPSETGVHATGTVSDGSNICVGADIEGRRHFLVPLAPAANGAPPFRSRGLAVRTRPLLNDQKERQYLDLVCLMPDLNGIFSRLILEILQTMQPAEPQAVEITLRVLEQWKELFGSSSTSLNRQQLVGLLGELTVLERLTAINPGTVNNWAGPLGGIHDFRFGRRALEIKTSTRRYGRIFTINGQEQLASPAGGDLHLMALRLDENPGGALSLATLVERVRHNGANPVSLQKRLAETGYIAGVNPDLDNARFDLGDFLIYTVTDTFPRIVKNSFASGEIPPGIIKLIYDIDLSGPDPPPLPASEADALIRVLATGGSQ